MTQTRQARGPVKQSNAAASSVALAGAIATTVASFLIAYLVSRSDTGFAGIFFAATAVATIAGNGLSLGTATSLVYFMPRATEGGRSAPRPLIVQAMRPVVICSVLAAAALVAIAPWFADLIAEERANEISTLIRWFAPAVPAWAITAGLLGATRGLGSMTPTVLVNQILRPGGQLTLLAALFLTSDPTAWQVGLAWTLPVVVGLVASLIALVRLGGAEGVGDSPIPPAEFWAYARPRALSTALQISLERIDVLFVIALIGAEGAGVYGALTRYIAAGNFLIYALAQASAVNMRRALAATDLTRAAALLRQTTSWLMLVAWPFFLIVALKPEPLANLLNPAYVADSGFLPILAVGMMISAAAGPIDSTLLMLGKSRLGLVGIGVAIAIDVVLLLVLAPRFGLAGAAVAWSVSVVGQNLLATAFVHRLAGISVVGPAWYRAGAAALIAVVPISLATGESFVDLLIVGGVSGIVLVALALRWRRAFGLVAGLPGR